MKRLVSLLAGALLLTFAPSVSAANYTSCQEGPPFETPSYADAGEYTHRDASQIQAIRGDWTAQSINDSFMATCSDPSNGDDISAASTWIAIAHDPSMSKLMQIGLARCAGGCSALTGAGNDSNGNPMVGIPNDNNVYLFWTFGGRPFADGPNGQGAAGIKIAAWNGYQAPRFAILRTCNQTNCSDPFYRGWYFSWSQDGTDPVSNLSGSPTASYPNHGWVQLDEWYVPWAVDGSTTIGKGMCETWDFGDQCGWNEAGSSLGLIGGVQVKDFNGSPTSVPPAWSSSWVNPKFTPSTCDYMDSTNSSVFSCESYTSSGGNPESRVGSVRLETLNTR